ncbi:glutamate racemase [Thalassotalea sp. ND16A]|uniref:glutamate racemase n=1 Tax=Thalassotalea sp. ND16A TaxID=1535422 RepID=UPI00051A546F|nr:glutamate racemase [Thalassotalea sp. ND16A]KGJ93368.1 Glutamate racemase [Thalassotalea sp. ND16A]
MEKQKPIGIFDSGVGGLSICHAIRRALPEENLVYFADIGFSPYGVKSKDIINERSEYIVSFLINQGCKAVVVACNTATVNTISNLRAKFSIPIIGVEPGIKPAALQSKTGIISVLATEQTLESDSFQRLMAKYSKAVKINAIACPKFVTLVENLEHYSEQAVDVAEQYIRPLLTEGSDQIILGCTHFSFLRTIIDQVVGQEANVIDTAAPVAMEVNRRLDKLNLLNSKNTDIYAEFWTSGDYAKVIEPMSQLWGQDIHLFAIRA